VLRLDHLDPGADRGVARRAPVEEFISAQAERVPDLRRQLVGALEQRRQLRVQRDLEAQAAVDERRDKPPVLFAQVSFSERRGEGRCRKRAAVNAAQGLEGGFSGFAAGMADRATGGSP
jgi:hypothetical protein